MLLELRIGIILEQRYKASCSKRKVNRGLSHKLLILKATDFLYLILFRFLCLKLNDALISAKSFLFILDNVL